MIQYKYGICRGKKGKFAGYGSMKGMYCVIYMNGNMPDAGELEKSLEICFRSGLYYMKITVR